MDFLNWWFEQHYIISVIMTSPITFAWCWFKGETLRASICAILIIFCGFRIGK